MVLYIVLIVLLIYLAYLYGTRSYKYWEDKGVKYCKPVPFFGSMMSVFLQRKSMTDFFTELYRRYPEDKYVGSYMGQGKSLILRDPELIKHVLITDFHCFYPRGFNMLKEKHKMLMNLFMADGDVWKLLRQRLTPAFTSGKLKAMFPLIVEKAEDLKSIAAEAAESGKEVDVRDLMARFATDFIGTCAFGIDANSMHDEDSSFRQLGKRIMTPSFRVIIVNILKILAPKLFTFIKPFPAEIEEPLLYLVRKIMKERHYKPSSRNDFIDLMLDLQQKGKMVGESIEHKNPDGTPQMAELELDDEIIASQVFIFFVAGFETSSSTTSYTLHQLAYHPVIQKKCQDEIDEVLSRYDNKLCFEAVREMKYLNMAFNESMRKFPSVGFLMRSAAKKYTFPGTDLTIDKDVSVIIPSQALQTDDKYFKNPEEFNPDRFHPDNVNDITNHVFMPFGEGPRACIGERLGLMQSMAGLAAVLSEFTVAPSTNSLKIPISDPASGIVQMVKGGLPLNLVSRKKSI
ncbi:cytochrome P450 6B6-like [Choristoneura fumiferana]|uniref:cytochrome P450 6B6-like n=1 Tax=Choristoneura fumiferana TaxID=7141 RepID=UPI003D156605